LNKLHKSNYFKYLPDPIYKYGYDKQNIRLNGFSHNSYKYLIFGALDERKNITNVLTAYNAASLTFKSEILLVGPVQQPYLDYLNELIRGLKTIDNDHKKVFIRGEFVTNEEMEYYFSVSDVCLLTYKDFFGSSGLLGRAALHKKKVIGSNVGVISSLIDQYKLGITCDPHSIESISSGLSSVKSFTPDPGLFKSYYEKHSPEVFLKTLLKVESE
jgi:glycosyltransferase involved in cell wall biosynthesis